MRTFRIGKGGIAAAFAAALVVPSSTPSVADDGPGIKHVLVISVDGMHQADLDWFLRNHPNSALAKLVGTGVEYTANSTSRPSDSFPGLLAFFTGGTPISHGVFYDDTYDHTLFPPPAVNGGMACSGPAGTEVSNFEFLDSSWNIGAGQVTDLFNVLDPTHMAGLKTADGNCVPVFPHLYLENQTNTVFEVLHQAGLHTAWSDKHPAYEILAGHSGKGLDELYAPEINSTSVSFTLNSLNPVKYPNNFASCDPIAAAHCDVTLPGGMVVSFGDDWTTDPAETRMYDQIKVQRVLNWIDGLEADGKTRDPKGTPAIYGMNFQAVSVAQKVTKAMQCSGAHPEDALSLVSTCTAPFIVRGGYYPDLSPEPPLQQSLDYVDGALGSMLAELKKGGHLNSTLFIVGAKHGQSPNDVSTLHMEPGSNPFAIKDVADPADVLSAAGISLAQETADDVSLLWLTNHADTAAAVSALRNPAFNVRIDKIYADVPGADAPVKDVWGDPADGRVPDIIIQPLHGTIYSGSKKKLSEHGGFTGTTPTIANEDDNTHTVLVVSNPHLAPGVVKTATSNMQIAPTILKALGLDPQALNAVRREGTTILPGLGILGM
jgi:predicted AlkP superfamily pyrophosphatase or phosphodiesterase